jgi:hypothetical protein
VTRRATALLTLAEERAMRHHRAVGAGMLATTGVGQHRHHPFAPGIPRGGGGEGCAAPQRNAPSGRLDLHALDLDMDHLLRVRTPPPPPPSAAMAVGTAARRRAATAGASSLVPDLDLGRVGGGGGRAQGRFWHPLSGRSPATTLYDGDTLELGGDDDGAVDVAELADLLQRWRSELGASNATTATALAVVDARQPADGARTLVAEGRGPAVRLHHGAVVTVAVDDAVLMHAATASAYAPALSLDSPLDVDVEAGVEAGVGASAAECDVPEGGAVAGR